MKRQISIILLTGCWIASIAQAGGSYPWLASSRSKPPPVFPELGVDAVWLQERLGQPGLVVADVRSEAAYRAGHLPAAVRLPLEAQLNTDVELLRRRLGELGLSGLETVVLYGDSDLETLGRLFWQLERAGIKEARVLAGGLAGWSSAGGALETTVRELPSQPFVASPGPPATVDLAWLLEHYGRSGTEILDLRDGVDWTRNDYEPPPRFAAGHVPGSLPYDARSLLDAEGGLPEPAAAHAVFAKLGPRAATRVSLEATFVLLGEDENDPRLGLAYLLLRSIGIETRVFPGGFRAWAAGSSLPLVRIVSAAEVRALLETENPGLTLDQPPRQVIVLDNRGDGAFAASHLPGARALPAHLFGSTLETVVAQEWPEVDRAKVPMILYCYGADCVRSRNCASVAAQAGFRNLLWFRDGWPGWTKAGYPWFATPKP